MSDHARTAKSKAAILVVEDHLETRTFLDLALADKFSVDAASDATSALEMVDQRDYDLLLVNIALRDTMDGIELVGHLRKRPAYADTPFIAMTAQQLRQNRDEYIDQGFDEFLAKPFYPEELLETIHELLNDGLPGDYDATRPPR